MASEGVANEPLAVEGGTNELLIRKSQNKGFD
jgi:hypothetical protein